MPKTAHITTSTFYPSPWELISRFTWQGIQTSSGFAAAQAVNTFSSQMNWVEHKYGTTVTNVGTGSWGGITLGSYIMGSTNIEADADNFLFQHEYGHYIQSQRFGPFYLSKVGLPSLLSSGDHDLHPVEQDANVRAFTYFNKNIEGYEGWKYKKSENGNPIINYDWSQPFDSETNQNALKNGKIRLKWYDYLLPLHYSAIINVLKFNNR